MTDNELKLQHLSLRLRKIASPIGSLHSFWDIISDIESHLKGGPTILKMTTEEWIDFAESLLKGK